MSFSSKIKELSGKSLLAKVREERRRNNLKASARRRVFEALEQRQMLDAASLYETLPEVITIADPDSYHYAYEGKPLDFIDTSSVEGLTASFVAGNQVAFTIMKTSTEGAVSSLGEVVVQLFSSEGEAPNSSSRFMQLVNDDYYEGLTFHRIIKGFMFQGGSSDGYGFEGSELGSIADEHSSLLTHSSRGIVAFANSGPNSSNAQFYITFNSTDWLDNGYNVFGYVVDGYDAIAAMENAATHTVDHPTRTTIDPETGQTIPYPVKDFPVETYKIANMRVVVPDNVSQSALRVVAAEGASGKTSLAFTSTTADNELKFQETTIYAGQSGLYEYVADSLAKTNFEFTAGETVQVHLPKSFGGYAVQYTVTPAVEPQGYTIQAADATYADFSLVTTPAAGQFTTLTIKASLSNGVTTSIDQQVFISPSKPTVQLQSSATTKVGELNEDVKIISSNLAASPLEIAVSFPSLDPGTSTETPINLFIDGSEYAFTLKSHNYNTETQIDSYVLSVQLKNSQALADGMHTLSVRQFIPIDRVMDHERLFSETVILDVMVDTQPLHFVEATKTFDINVDDVGLYQLHTNKADEDGVERSDIAFSLAKPDAGPRFISLTEYGVLSWQDVTNDDCGLYYVDVNAVDALGNKATMKLTLNVGYVPVFENIEPLNATTGQKLEATIVATVPSAEEVDMKYELVGDDLPAGMAINAATGKLTWNVPENYFTNNKIKLQKTEIVVKATSQLEGQGGTVVDGYSTEKTIPLTINNALFEAEGGAPVWTDVPNQTTEPGAVFTVNLHAAVEGDKALLYELRLAPETMTIDAETGKITWNVPEDFFASDATQSQTLTIEAQATAIVSSDGSAVNYGASSTKTFLLTVTNPEFVDYAPEFSELDVSETTTGATYVGTISASDPNELADRVALELVGTDYPAGLDFDAQTGKITWSIPSNYLNTWIAYRVVSVKIKATEQFADGEGGYDDGLSSEQTFEIRVANEGFNPETSVAPVWKPIADQTVAAGQTFTLGVSATVGQLPGGHDTELDEDDEDDGSVDVGGDAPQDDKEYKAAYAIVGTRPEGMTINPATGVISWNVPANYFTSNDKSATIKIDLKATTILDEDGPIADYGDSSTTSFNLTITNPNFVDNGPEFDELETITAQTGATYTATISATDPEGLADRIVYELVGDDYPASFNFNAATGVITWAIPADYLATNVAAQTFSFTIKATEQYEQENGQYTDGASTEKTFGIMVANAAYEDEVTVSPVFEPIAPQKVTAGQTFELTVVAKATGTKVVTTEKEDGSTEQKVETINYGVEYSLGDAEPEGMTINAETGKITWAVAEDYFDSNAEANDKITITVNAKTIVSETDVAVNYGGSASTSFELTIANPNYDPGYASWQEWFDAWVGATQARYDSHSANLTNYLNAYLEAVQTRKTDLASAKADYAAGRKTLTEFLQAREEAVSDFNETVADARDTLVENDAQADQEYFDTIGSLNSAFDNLASKEDFAKPGNVKQEAQEAADNAVRESVARATGSSNFRFTRKTNAASVATNLTSVLKLWRDGYSYSTVYDEVYSDKLFTDYIGD